MKFIVSASLLSADWYKLAEEVAKVESIQESWLHIDVMDGNFVPQISFGSSLVADIKAHTKLPIDVHLMVDNPESQIEQFAEAGADYITFHVEESHFPLRLINTIKSFGIKAGISLNPFTPLSTVENILPYIDLLLIMSVEPGFSGQSFLPFCKGKIISASNARKENHLQFLISVDGGVCAENASEIVQYGADVLVMGNFFFKNPFDKVKKTIEELKNPPL
ncbi:MAG: ribulose-phosphate 3-epimerase [Caldisericaceae bacterium]